MRVEVGDKVLEDDFGEGLVVETPSDLRHIGLVRVLFSKPPPIRYNMGENPTPIFERDLSIIERG